ncbi:MAG TPA: T9SS type A sorting domain-containing protein [Candidatus Krumholzibacteria bacterium]|nr:T9SS type A sorting domain-containing protein [Candidatus Krumholzibacteria bacterium]
MCTPRSIFVLVTSVVVSHALPSLAAWPLNGEEIAIVTGNQSFPVITRDAAGGAIIVWSDTRNGDSDIYAQRIDASGAVQWTTNGVAVSTMGGAQYAPMIIPDGSGGAIIVFSHASGQSDIFAQRIDAAGVTQWAPGGVPVCLAIEDQFDARITSDGAGGAIVTWYDWRDGQWDIYAQRIDASGSVQWTTDGVAVCAAVNDQYGPTIVADGSGGAIIAWYDYRGGPSDLYAQRINAAGVAQWTEDGVTFCTATNDQYAPMFASDGASGAICTWLDYRSGVTDVYVQRIDGSGAAQWTSNGVALCTATGEQFYPEIVADGFGGACVSWWDRRGPNADIYAQRVNASGAVQWTANGVVMSAASNDQVYPKIASDGAGGAIVTWFDFRTGTGDIYAQRVNASGAVHWTVDGLALCTAANQQTYPSIVSSGGSAIIAWQDWRNGGLSDVYAQRVDIPTPVGNMPAAAFTVLQNYPNPFTGATELRVQLAIDANVSIDVYDVAGRRVYTQSHGEQKAGLKTFPFAGRDDAGRPLSSGVYFYRITANGTTITNKMVIAR